jgi:tRNA A37 threonylcarbamoyladenosine synthetase subunit TsaC/SUA5/YrdC
MIYLAQTDTTVGFLSNSKEELAKAKRRDPKQPFIICVSDFRKLKKLTRIPKKQKKLVRRSEKTTFVYPNNLAIRVVKRGDHHNFLKKFEYLFSTSANRHQEEFSLPFAMEIANEIILPVGGFRVDSASTIIKLSKNRKKVLRKL